MAGFWLDAPSETANSRFLIANCTGVGIVARVEFMYSPEKPRDLHSPAVPVPSTKIPVLNS